MSLLREIQTAINKHSAENESNTPDFILAVYLTDCLLAFNAATRSREQWRRQERTTHKLAPDARSVCDDFAHPR